ncbi:hypothetical protein [Nitrobacter sp. Nb-311A]|uniref:hypothetical protein n=1 Tax=Nitrobacter sp. Nb-311A TaxID=314253 RepID=UPI00103A3ECB|nr:hypothetical protein [Nitrobacter sp. Nb-311A]
MLPMLVCIAGIYIGLYFKFLTSLPVSVLGGGVSIVFTASAEQSFANLPVALLFPIILAQVKICFWA